MCLHVKEKRNKRNRLYFTLLSNLFIKYINVISHKKSKLFKGIRVIL